MQLLGRILRKQRESMGISLWEAQEGTKIAVHYLQAMEQGNFRSVPGGEFYLKGFLKSYGDFIGLDGPAVVKYFQELSAGQPDYKSERTFTGSLCGEKKSGVIRNFCRSLVSFM